MLRPRTPLLNAPVPRLWFRLFFVLAIGTLAVFSYSPLRSAVWRSSAEPSIFEAPFAAHRFPARRRGTSALAFRPHRASPNSALQAVVSPPIFLSGQETSSRLRLAHSPGTWSKVRVPHLKPGVNSTFALVPSLGEGLPFDGGNPRYPLRGREPTPFPAQQQPKPQNPSLTPLHPKPQVPPSAPVSLTPQQAPAQPVHRWPAIPYSAPLHPQPQIPVSAPSHPQPHDPSLTPLHPKSQIPSASPSSVPQRPWRSPVPPSPPTSLAPRNVPLQPVPRMPENHFPAPFHFPPQPPPPVSGSHSPWPSRSLKTPWGSQTSPTSQTSSRREAEPFSSAVVFGGQASPSSQHLARTFPHQSVRAPAPVGPFENEAAARVPSAYPKTSSLAVGKTVNARVLKVGPHFAILELEPLPQWSRSRESAWGYLHVSNILRDGRRLSRDDPLSRDLSTWIGTGSLVKVELMEAPTPQTLGRWQCALRVGDADKEALERPAPPWHFSPQRSSPPFALSRDRVFSTRPDSDELGRSAWLFDTGESETSDADQDSAQSLQKTVASRRYRRGFSSSKARPASSRVSSPSRGRLSLKKDSEILDPKDFLDDAEEEAAPDPQAPSAFSPSTRAMFLSLAQDPIPTSSASHAAKASRSDSQKKKKQTNPAAGEESRSGDAALSSTRPRSVVVAVMGHVDHGKTTLLRALRSLQEERQSREGASPQPRQTAEAQEKSSASFVASKFEREAGGITQKIGFFKVRFPPELGLQNSEFMTFLDTPGHAAFKEMRLRAAKAADVVVLAVAVNEGLQPETLASIRACEESQTPVVVAFTKVDIFDKAARPSAAQRSPAEFLSAFLNSPRSMTLQSQLAEQGLLAETLGGQVQMTAVDARGFVSAVGKRERNGEEVTGEVLSNLAAEFGLSDLVERVALQAAVLDLKARSEGAVRGFTLETSLSPSAGGSVVVVVMDGALSVGDWVVCGDAFCKVRSMRRATEVQRRTRNTTPSASEAVTTALPGDVVEVFGFSSNALPPVGTQLYGVTDEAEAARQAHTFFLSRRDERAEDKSKIARDEAWRRLFTGQESTELPVVVRANSLGAAEALKGEIADLEAEESADGVWHISKAADREAGVSPEDEGAESSNSAASPPQRRRVVVVRSGAGVCCKEDLDVCRDAQGRPGLLLAYGTSASKKFKHEASMRGVALVESPIIYELVEAVERRLAQQILFPDNSDLSQSSKETPSAEARVKQVFKLRSGLVIAGCDVTKGSIRKGDWLEVRRDGKVLKRIRVTSLRIKTTDVEEAPLGCECGVVGNEAVEWQIGDILKKVAEPLKAPSSGT